MSEELYEAWAEGHLTELQAAELQHLLADPARSREFARHMRERVLLGVACKQRTAVEPTPQPACKPAKVLQLISLATTGAVAAGLVLAVGLWPRSPEPPHRPSPPPRPSDLTIDLDDSPAIRYAFDLENRRQVRLTTTAGQNHPARPHKDLVLNLDSRAGVRYAADIGHRRQVRAQVGR